MIIGEGQELLALSEATLAKPSRPASRVDGFQTSHVTYRFDHDQNLMSELPVQTLVPILDPPAVRESAPGQSETPRGGESTANVVVAHAPCLQARRLS